LPLLTTALSGEGAAEFAPEVRPQEFDRATRSGNR
jgi:hypothetical protein